MGRSIDDAVAAPDGEGERYRRILAVAATASAVAVAAVVTVHRGHAFAALAGVLVALAGAAAAVDERAHRIPNELVAAGGLLLVAVAVLVVAVDHRSVETAAVCGALAYAAPLVLLHLVSPGGIGAGDVKLGAVLGLGLGVGHPVLAPLALLAACVAAIARRAVLRQWRAPQPFAPAMAVGAAVVLVAARPLVGALGFGWW